MDLTLTEEEAKLVAAAEALQDGFAQRAREYDELASFPTEDFEELRRDGFLGMTTPIENGGMGLWQDRRYLAYYLVLNALGKGAASTAWLLKIHCHASGLVARHGNAEQRARILGDVVENGALLTSLGSEAAPGRAGTPNQYPTGQTEMFRRDDGGLELNCTKHFGTVAPAAKYHIVHTRMPGEGTPAERYQLVAIPKDRPGLSLIDNWEDAGGGRATVSWAVRFDHVAVEPGDLLGSEGDWVYDDPRTFTLGHAAILLGVAEGIHEFVLHHVAQREGLAENDAIVYQLGTFDSQLQACRTSVWYAAWLWESQRYNEAEQATLRALHVTKEAALLVTSRAFEIYGARSAFRNLPFDRAWRDVRMLSLHHRETSLIRMLVDAQLGHPYHSKQNYGLPRSVA